jgi:hypothetical protein
VISASSDLVLSFFILIRELSNHSSEELSNHSSEELSNHSSDEDAGS